MNDLDLRHELDAIDDGGPLPVADLQQATLSRVRRHRRRRLAATIGGTAIAVVLVTVALNAALRADRAASTITTGGPTNQGTAGSPHGTTTRPGVGIGDEGYVNPERAAKYHDWLNDYDPAEIARLRSQWADAPDENLVVTLEFRRACRVTNDAWAKVTNATGNDRQLAAYQVMDPEIARLNERKPSDKDQSATMFQDLRDKLIAGETDYVRHWLDTDCRDVLQPPGISSTQTSAPS